MIYIITVTEQTHINQWIMDKVHSTNQWQLANQSKLCRENPTYGPITRTIQVSCCSHQWLSTVHRCQPLVIELFPYPYLKCSAAACHVRSISSSCLLLHKNPPLWVFNFSFPHLLKCLWNATLIDHTTYLLMYHVSHQLHYHYHPPSV